MTQDQLGELNGRFTALQMTGRNILAMTILMQSDISKIREYNLIAANGILQMKQTMMYSMDYLASISKNTFELYEINEGIKEIRKNTKGLISSK